MNKVAIITGSNSGVGAATAKLFAKEGAKVVITARRLPQLEEVANEMAATAGVKSTNSATLVKIATLLRRMHGDEDEIARNLDQLKSYLGTLGTWLNDSRNQALEIDYINVQPGSGSDDGPDVLVTLQLFGSFVVLNPANCAVGLFYAA